MRSLIQSTMRFVSLAAVLTALAVLAMPAPAAA
jgi:hypothetical protein